MKEIKKIDINEIFYSIEGEGIRAGQLAIFIRLNGCNLRCSYCDTKYALNNKNNYIDINTIINKIKKYNCKNITITGGEPLLQPNIIDIINSMPEYTFNLETNGSISINSYLLKNTIITMDYKTINSKMESYMNLKNLSLLRKKDVLKFVVSSKEDIEQAFKIIYKYKPKCNIFLSPVFNKISGSEIVEEMKKYKNDNLRLQLQIHKYIYDSNKRGV